MCYLTITNRVTKECAGSQNSTTKQSVIDDSQTILDLRAVGSRKRGSDMEKIIKEMDVEGRVSTLDNSNNSQKDSTEDDLIALIDSQL